MNETIGEFKGELMILFHGLPSPSEPLRFISYYPTGILAKDWPELIGKAVNHWQNGIYEFYPPISGRTKIALKDGGNTLPVYIEQIEIPKPSRGGKSWEWQWHYGKWEKRENKGSALLEDA